MDLAEQLQERILREIFGFHRIVDHAQAKGVNATGVKLKDGLKRGGVSLLCQANGLLQSHTVGFAAWKGRCRSFVRRNASFPGLKAANLACRAKLQGGARA